MPNFSFVLLYVENPPASAGFYADLLGRPIVETSPTFAMLPLREGVMLEMRWRKAVEPAASAQAGAGEVAFTVENAAPCQVTLHRLEEARTEHSPGAGADGFRNGSVATDPDGHRLRVFVPAAA